jgi:hypothetical protein
MNIANKTLRGSDNVLLSRNSKLQTFLQLFYSNNLSYFQAIIDGEEAPDAMVEIEYEKAFNKGSRGMQNKGIKKGLCIADEDHDTKHCSTLYATDKLVQMIISAIDC